MTPNRSFSDLGSSSAGSGSGAKWRDSWRAPARSASSRSRFASLPAVNGRSPASETAARALDAGWRAAVAHGLRTTAERLRPASLALQLNAERAQFGSARNLAGMIGVVQDSGMAKSALKLLERLVGEWSTEATHPMLAGVIVHGTAVVEWLEGGQFLMIRSRSAHPDFPEALSMIG